MTPRARLTPVVRRQSVCRQPAVRPGVLWCPVMKTCASHLTQLRTALLAAIAALALAAAPIGCAYAEGGGSGSGSSGGGGSGSSGSGSSGSGSSGSGSSGSGSSGSGSSGSGKGSGYLNSADQAQLRDAVAHGEAQSLGDIIPVLRRAAPGKILNISFSQGSAGYMYTFAVLTDAGRYFDVSIDAKSGSTLSMRAR